MVGNQVADCIASLPWRDDVIVLDSGSSDSTVTIAEGLGARVVTRKFTNYADQRNFGLGLPFQNEWIVMLDADERMTPELAAEIECVTRSADGSLAMLRVRRKDMLMGRWLRRSSGYPTWFPRVMRRGRVRVEREINEIYATDGDIRHLEAHLFHHPFNKGIDWWFERHHRYSTAEARLLAAGGATDGLLLRDLVSRDPGRRRPALKVLAYRMPARPFLTFLYLYLLRLGFLDGRAGYRYSMMRMAYEIMIDAKAEELRAALRRQDSPSPKVAGGGRNL